MASRGGYSTGSVREFVSTIRQWEVATQKRMETVVKDTAMEVFSNIVMLTPVLTGRARCNWNMSVDVPDHTTTKNVDPAGEQTISRARSVLQSTYKSGKSIRISNSLHYIRRLEYGWSRKAPNGMVRITAADFHNIVANVVRRVKNGAFGQ